MVNSHHHIVMLHREQLHPHPDNPRKDLGDLTELKESIKEIGIMQNLTVVPDKDGYKILIGHRRYAASEGILEDLPCVIAEGLSDREQLGIMLCENMQRSDLTIFEQAHGFQLMLDLGETVETISEKTGFSQSTVKHRLEINKLNKESINKAAEWFQLTIADYIALEKIKDIDARNEILSEAMSSKELREDVEDYLKEQLRKTNEKKYRDLCLSLGWKETKEYFYFWSNEPKWKEIPGMSKIDLEKPFNDESINAAAVRLTEPVFFKCDGWYFSFAVKTAAAKVEKKKTKDELIAEKRSIQEKSLNDKRVEMCDRYYEFIVSIPEKLISDLNDKDYKEILSNLTQILFDLDASMKMPDRYYNIKTHCDTKSHEKDYPKFSLIQKLMLVVWEHLSSTYENKLVQWNFTKNMTALKAHQDFYKVLSFFGFRLEKGHYLLAVINGKSDLYEVKL